MPRPCLVLRVFTRNGEGGNHLGVVTDLQGLDTSKMQQIANDLGFSETVFIDLGAGEAPHVRIFTPELELPFAGHPLVGSAWLMLRRLGTGVDRLECGIGDVAIRTEGEQTWVDVAMNVDKARVDDSGFAAAVRLAEAQSTWRVAMPLDYRMVELANASHASQAVVDLEAFGPAFGLAVYARSEDAVRMRFFTPEAGVNEDPATGSAAVALATMYAARGESEGSLTIDQGEEIGHPSRINLRWSGSAASIGGTVAEDETRELAI
ncbi:MAG: PhzF family phenazine biosynthesis protein [Acidimicrobiia bacterium]|nr:PhzF family phenazine biosynthesis protein [Acidimicrobiia bacterium]